MTTVTTTKISPEQAREIACLFREVSVAIGNYRFGNWNSLTSNQRQNLENLEWTLLNYSSDLITIIVGTIINNAIVSLGRIQESTTQAKHAIETINDIKKTIVIAGAVIKLGAAFVTKDPVMIGSAVDDIFTTLSS